MLEALPSHIQQKVVQGYARRGLPLQSERPAASMEHESIRGRVDPLVESGTSHIGRKELDAQEAPSIVDTEKITIDDEKKYLTAWKQYVCDWHTSFPEGPDEGDVSNVSNYLCKLARTNLEMTELCLKSFRRLIMMKCSDEDTCWRVSYDAVLQPVQERVRENYNGSLNIKPFNC